MRRDMGDKLSSGRTRRTTNASRDLAQLAFGVGKIDGGSLGTGDDDQLESGGKQRLFATERLAEQALYAIAHDGATDAARHGDAKTRRGRVLFQDAEADEARGVELASAVLDAKVVSAHANALFLGQPLSRGGATYRGHLLLSGDSDGQPLAALLAPARQDLLASAGGHAGAKAVGATTAGVMGLIRALHRRLLLFLRKRVLLSSSLSR